MDSVCVAPYNAEFFLHTTIHTHRVLLVEERRSMNGMRAVRTIYIYTQKQDSELTTTTQGFAAKPTTTISVRKRAETVTRKKG